MKNELFALCFELPATEGDALPEWLPLIPAGQFTGRDGRQWINDDPDTVVLNSQHPLGLPFDAEHSTEIKGPKGEEAPAYAWFKEFRKTADGAIEGRVEWTEHGADVVRSKKYRGYSPAFGHTATGRVTRLSSVGLTNKPNLDLPALNHEENPMNVPVQITSVLGLAATASADDAVKAIQGIKDAERTALNRAENPDVTKFIPVETHQLALNRAQTAEEKLAAREKADAEALVDFAIKEGKVAPANKEMYLATCRSEEGRKQFADFLKAAPKIVNPGDASKTKAEKSTGDLSAEDIAMCRSLGIKEEEFLAARQKETD